MNHIPSPPTMPPPSPSNTNSYRVARESELDAIRRRGLAKIFNKHFTTVAESIAKERAAAEAALAEIEQRKADLASNPKSFIAGCSKEDGWNLTQLDKLQRELARRKYEVLQKERETQELYRRYVSQYGTAYNDATMALLKNSLNFTGTKYSYSGGGGLIPIAHDAINDDAVRQADLLIAKLTERNYSTSLGNPTVENITRKLEERIKMTNAQLSTPESSPRRGSGNLRSPKGSEGEICRGTLAVAADSAPHLSEKNRSSIRAMECPLPEIPEFGPADAAAHAFPEFGPADAEAHAFLSFETISSPRALSWPITPAATTVSKISSFDRDDSTTEHSDVPADLDADSTMSALTEIDGATVAEAEWRLIQFLRVETENIRRMILPNPEEEFSACHALGREGDMSTIYSHDSKRSMEAAYAAEQMARHMAEASAWMKDPSKLIEEDSNDEKERDSDEIPELISSSGDCEWHAYWSGEHNREYYYNSNTKQTCWTKPQLVYINMSTLNIPGGMKHAHQEEVVAEIKDYTRKSVEIHDNQQNVSSMAQNMEMIDLYRPDLYHSINDDNSMISGGSHSMMTSKVSEYRHLIMIRKRRKKNRLIVVAVIIISLSTALHFWKNRRETTAVVVERSNEERFRVEAETLRRFETNDLDKNQRTLVEQRKEVEINAFELLVLKIEAEETTRMAEQESTKAENGDVEHNVKLIEEATRQLNKEINARFGTKLLLNKMEQEVGYERVSDLERKVSSENLHSLDFDLNGKESALELKIVSENKDATYCEINGNEVDVEVEIFSESRIVSAFDSDEIRVDSKVKVILDNDNATEYDELLKRDGAGVEMVFYANDIAKAVLPVEVELDLFVDFKVPLGCRMPFSYLFSRHCWFLTMKRPLFDMESFINSIMQ